MGCAAIGTGILNQLCTTGLERSSDRWIVSLWLGVIGLAITLLAVSLFVPLSPCVGTIVLLSLGFLSFCSRRTRDELKHYQSKVSKSLIVRFLGIAIVIAAISSQPVVWVDTGFYHYGLIQWLAQFGTVPGLALLYSPLGFTSSWFAFAAPLNASFLEARGSAVTNGFAVLIAVLQVWMCFSQIGKRQGTIGDWFIVATTLLLLPLILLSKTLQVIIVSPSPDLAIVFLIIVVAWVLLILSSQDASRSDARLIPVIISAGAVTIKLTALPLLAVSSLFLISKDQKVRYLLLGMTGVSLILAPFFISGIITSGCPLYPSTSICFDLPWSPSTSMLQQVASSTHQWASWYETQPTNLSEWLTLIWTWFIGERRNQVVIGFGFVSVIGVVYLLERAKGFYDQGQLWVIAVGLSGVGFLMVTSPLLRFQLAYILVIPGLLMAQFYVGSAQVLLERLDKVWLSARKPMKQFIRFAIAIIAATVVVHTNVLASVVLPPRLPSVEVMKKQVNNMTYFYPQKANNRMCWAAPLPCTSAAPENIGVRDPSKGIASGFIYLNRR